MAMALACTRAHLSPLSRPRASHGVSTCTRRRWSPPRSADDVDLETEELSEADRLRAEEKFMVKGSGNAVCQSCTYKYEANRGDPEYPVAAGTRFEDLPEDWRCPVCAADKSKFTLDSTVIAGFAANQGYGLGTNSMTPAQKNLLIWGSLGFFFALFLAGYAFD
eukprot:scaffold24_cov341-Pavlova_lutheri.AAC.90